jgi:CRISPR-associated protein Cas1
MPVLYVTEQDATVRVSAKSLVVTLDVEAEGKDGAEAVRHRRLIEVEPHRLEMIGLVGRTHITSDALHLCLEMGIDISWFAWNGCYLGRIVPKLSRSGDLRLRQYGTLQDSAACQKWARRTVDAKVANCREVLQDIRSNDSQNQVLAEAVRELARLQSLLAGSDSPERLLGLEGSAARVYFQALGSAFRAEIIFDHRERRPPPDPANALLSFAYVLLGNRLGGMLEARGLDPALGFFHEAGGGRPSLALDLLEEFRAPVVDRFVLRSCNLRILRKDMFEPDQENIGGVRLTKDGLKTFFQEWEAHLLRPLREKDGDSRLAVLPLLERQIERVVADLRGTEAYRPFLYGG